MYLIPTLENETRKSESRKQQYEYQKIRLRNQKAQARYYQRHAERIGNEKGCAII